MKPTPYDDYWRDPQNWKWHLFYVCKDDPRVIVPKRPTWMGRTLNFAHRKSLAVLALTLLAIIFPIPLIGAVSMGVWLIIWGLVLAAVVAFYYTATLTQGDPR